MTAVSAFDPLPKEAIASVRRKLKLWSRRHRRNLPWRDESDPYKVWVSEIMLQQTTVVAVVPFYERFLARFPTVRHLARADEQAVLKVWEGLGYYSRARNMHRAARQIVQDHGGRFPNDVAELVNLPGIGRYTAGAIASFAYGVAAPILEANTLRLYSRLAGFEGDPHSTAGQRFLWSFAEQLVPRNEPGRFNQALMDLGAIVCTPNDPDCPHCPLQSHCQTWLNDKVSEIPRPKSRPAVTSLVDVCVAPRVARKRDTLLLRQYSADERWSGLWDFPRLTLLDGRAADAFDSAEPKQILDSFRRTLELKLSPPTLFHELRHTVTRYRIRLLCYEATVAVADIKRLNGEWQQFPFAELDHLPMTATARRIARVLIEKGKR